MSFYVWGDYDLFGYFPDHELYELLYDGYIHPSSIQGNWEVRNPKILQGIVFCHILFSSSKSLDVPICSSAD